MSTYNEGDLIEAVKGETKIVGRIVAEPGDASVLFVEGVGMGTNSLRYDGFTLTVLEKAAPPLPTESGWYQSESHGMKYLFQLSEHDCGWFYVGNEYQPAPRRRNPTSDETLTRLEPVPVTVQKVIDYLVSNHLLLPVGDGGGADAALRHFGLTS